MCPPEQSAPGTHSTLKELRMTARTSPLQHVLLAGCGDLGERVGTLLHAQGTPVTGIRRRPKPHGLPFPVLGMDLAEPDRRHELPAADAVVIAMTADEPTHEGYERAYRQTLAGLASILPRPLPAWCSSHRPVSWATGTVTLSPSRPRRRRKSNSQGSSQCRERCIRAVSGGDRGAVSRDIRARADTDD